MRQGLLTGHQGAVDREDPVWARAGDKAGRALGEKPRICLEKKLFFQNAIRFRPWKN